MPRNRKRRLLKFNYCIQPNIRATLLTSWQVGMYVAQANRMKFTFRGPPWNMKNGWHSTSKERPCDVEVILSL